MRDKRGVVGLDLAKAFLLILVLIAVIGFVTIVAVSVLDEAADTMLPIENVSVANETLTDVTSDSIDTLSAINKVKDPDCVWWICSNTTSKEEIDLNNYTLFGKGNCSIIYAGKAGDAYNNSNWDCQYNYVYVRGEAHDVAGNVTTGISDFFADTGTWLTLLSVVVIILIIGIVIIAVGRFGGGVAGRRSDSVEGL